MKLPATAIVIVLAVAASLLSSPISDRRLAREPAYNHRSLGLWVSDFDYRKSNESQLAEVSNALHQIGAKRLPFLVNELKAKPVIPVAVLNSSGIDASRKGDSCVRVVRGYC